MKALCVRQPYADNIADGLKTIECRSWDTSYRGPLLIVASGLRGGSEAICIVDLIDVQPFTMLHAADAMMLKKRLPGHFAWVVSNPRRIEPFKVLGKLKIFEVNHLEGA